MKFRRRIRTRTLREKHRRLLLDRIARSVALVGAVILLLSQLSLLDVTGIQTISVRGNEALPMRALFDTARSHLSGHYLGLFAKRHILLYPRSHIERAVRDAFPRVNTIDVDFEDLTTISITVTERRSVGQYCLTTNTCYLIDGDGFIFAKAAHFTQDNAFMYLDENATTTRPIGTQFLSPSAFSELRLFINNVAARGIAIHHARIETPNRFALVMEGGGDIIFDPEDGYDALLENLAIVFSSREFGDVETIDYVDLRFGNRIFYKPRE